MSCNNHINITSLNALSILSQLPGYVVCVDNSHRVNYYCNDRYSHIAGFDKTDDILGSKPDELRCRAAECADTFIKQNNQVMDERATLKIIDIHPYRNDEIKIFLTYKTPILDHNKNALGVICHANEITQHNLLNITSTLIEADKKYHYNNNKNQRSYNISNKFEKSELTPREMECLFYLIRGKTAKKIALILSISPRTVESHIANIKAKLNCETKSDLIDKSIDNKFINYIPESILMDANVNESIIIEVMSGC